MNPDEFELELRSAFRREAAPADFAARVMARVPRRRSYLPWALAAGLVVGAVIPSALYERRQARAVEARRELVVALTITRAKIHHTQEVIQHRAHRI